MNPTRNSSNSDPVRYIVISEFFYHSQTSSFEYIILYNPGPSTLSLWDNETSSGWRLDGGISYVFDQSSTIEANSYLFIAGFDPNVTNMQAFEQEFGTMPVNIDGSYNGALSNGGERIALEKPILSDDPTNPDELSWMIIDEVIYSDQAPWPVEADGLAKSLRRKSTISWGNLPSSWFAATPMSNALSGDFNSDGIVDLYDFVMFSQKWLYNSENPQWDHRYELYESYDEMIDVKDLLRLCEQWLSETSN